MQYDAGGKLHLLRIDFPSYSASERTLENKYHYLAVNPSGDIIRRVLSRKAANFVLEQRIGNDWVYVDSLPGINFTVLNDPVSETAPLWIYTYSLSGEHSLYCVKEEGIELAFGPQKQPFEVVLDRPGNNILWVLSWKAENLDVRSGNLISLLEKAGFDKPDSIALKRWGRHDSEAILEVKQKGKRKLILADWKAETATVIEGIGP